MPIDCSSEIRLATMSWSWTRPKQSFGRSAPDFDMLAVRRPGHGPAKEVFQVIASAHLHGVIRVQHATPSLDALPRHVVFHADARTVFALSQALVFSLCSLPGHGRRLIPQDAGRTPTATFNWAIIGTLQLAMPFHKRRKPGGAFIKLVELPNFPSDFQRESLKLVNSLLEIKSSAFYLVDPDLRHRGLVTNNLTKEDDKLYQRRYMQLDPLNPALYEKSGDTVIHMDSILSAQVIEQLAYYQDFLKPMGLRYVTDMFFRSEGRIIAVITMLRSKSQGAFTSSEQEVLRKLQPFLEYTLNNVYLPDRISERKSIQEKYELTARELDVLELVLSGASNKIIASELMLGIPTVKTHLQHIYRKTAVTTRTELLTRVIAYLNMMR